jgi:predicted glycogen debranching enzyme
MPLNRAAEWLEADGLGGFASGTVGGRRTRRYHALLLAATTPPTGRFVLVNGFDAWVETDAGSFALTSQHYGPDVLHPDGERRLATFESEPWPRWTYRLEDGSEIEQELFVPHETQRVAIRWRYSSPSYEGGAGGVRLRVRLFLSGRDYHSLHHENAAFRFDADTTNGWIVWQPYAGVPGIIAQSNGVYEHQPVWYGNFLYAEERQRGLDHTEDLASPGVLSWNLTEADATLILGADVDAEAHSETLYPVLRQRELERRRRFASPLHRAADAYLVRRGQGKTIIAGYPWFTDWGRDTFIALRGLCLATDRLDDARDILLDWAGTVSEGMLPNLFPDRGSAPEYNSVDASLWYIIAVHEYLQAAKLHPDVQRRLHAAVEAILTGYAAGTRFGIRLDDDGLLAAGVPGVQLTWMDAKVGDWVVTPRIGKPVEVQALWLNALWIASRFNDQWRPLFERGRTSFESRFWHDAGGYLADVVDPDGRRGTMGATLRPNQIFAVGGLPVALLDGQRARRVVDVVEASLLTPLGLRSLAPGSASYAPRYRGGVRERDGAYHQGTVWPWLMGAFVEAWVRVRRDTPEAKREARARFVEPLLQHLGDAGLGHVSEIADAELPHTPRGCPFQAWSLGELLRLMEKVLHVSEGLQTALLESKGNNRTAQGNALRIARVPVAKP